MNDVFVSELVLFLIKVFMTFIGQSADDVQTKDTLALDSQFISQTTNLFIKKIISQID